ncbi:aldo/keto reductase [Beutenbergia cavernae DSM 12333]|uniref:Aldo/keto reductase n=1 Tax=Beutenbergia cavernae (strain ATCC BAA-8 / DSM 12333 / CCUG 43141 / JCM 11478 / NBRC 16432 / NCIMB 13614 / HKI 0122) TaxID=471853 RepID=C5BUY2_BEUC1|nr:aldo/keto reductase [Beutenbergia cavernae]ACQ78356.1 aldo/keto reductase [Beutenbergia cavernae DSM 12333]
MKTFTLPGTELVVPNVVLGLMRIAEMSDDDVRHLVRTARDAGIDFVDHADIYGGDHGCERRFAEAMRLTPSQRAEIVIQSKAGIVPGAGGLRYDFSYDHLVGQVDGSLAALGTDYLDILLLHRPDALVEPEEVARAFDDLASAGKVRYFGVSNHTPGQIELLKKYVTQPLVANQLQLSITHASLIAQGVSANMAGEDQAVDRDGGVLDYCRLHDITIQAWSPFQAGFFTGVFLGSPDHPELNAVIDRLAAAYDVPPIAVATAWITRHPAQMQVVLGTTTPERVTGAAQGSDLPLTRAEWYELFRAAGHLVP